MLAAVKIRDSPFHLLFSIDDLLFTLKTIENTSGSDTITLTNLLLSCMNHILRFCFRENCSNIHIN